MVGVTAFKAIWLTCSKEFHFILVSLVRTKQLVLSSLSLTTLTGVSIATILMFKLAPVGDDISQLLLTLKLLVAGHPSMEFTGVCDFVYWQTSKDDADISGLIVLFMRYYLRESFSTFVQSAIMMTALHLFRRFLNKTWSAHLTSELLRWISRIEWMASMLIWKRRYRLDSLANRFRWPCT